MSTESKVVTILTIGHSTNSLEDLVALLKENEVTLVADVRTMPRSGHKPQFNKDTLADDLAGAGIKYRHLAGLGGMRRPIPDSPNAAWRNAGFRGFADHMQTSDFVRSLEDLIQIAEKETVALMCAEAVPWRCHRSLIADALVARGTAVEHIMGTGNRRPHSLNRWAQVTDGAVVYPAQNQAEDQG